MPRGKKQEIEIIEENWAQCEACEKWRKLPPGTKVDDSVKWTCKDNPDLRYNSCDAPEESWEPTEEVIIDTTDPTLEEQKDAKKAALIVAALEESKKRKSAAAAAAGGEPVDAPAVKKQKKSLGGAVGTAGLGSHASTPIPEAKPAQAAAVSQPKTFRSLRDELQEVVKGCQRVMANFGAWDHCESQQQVGPHHMHLPTWLWLAMHRLAPGATDVAVSAVEAYSAFASFGGPGAASAESHARLALIAAASATLPLAEQAMRGGGIPKPKGGKAQAQQQQQQQQQQHADPSGAKQAAAAAIADGGHRLAAQAQPSTAMNGLPQSTGGLPGLAGLGGAAAAAAGPGSALSPHSLQKQALASIPQHMQHPGMMGAAGGASQPLQQQQAQPSLMSSMQQHAGAGAGAVGGMRPAGAAGMGSLQLPPGPAQGLQQGGPGGGGGLPGLGGGLTLGPNSPFTPEMLAKAAADKGVSVQAVMAQLAGQYALGRASTGLGPGAGPANMSGAPGSSGMMDPHHQLQLQGQGQVSSSFGGMPGQMQQQQPHGGHSQQLGHSNFSPNSLQPLGLPSASGASMMGGGMQHAQGQAGMMQMQMQMQQRPNGMGGQGQGMAGGTGAGGAGGMSQAMALADMVRNQPQLMQSLANGSGAGSGGDMQALASMFMQQQQQQQQQPW